MGKIEGQITWKINVNRFVGFGNEKNCISKGNGDIISTGDRTCQADFKKPNAAGLGIRAGHFTGSTNWEFPKENKECPFKDGNSIRIREITLGIFSVGWVDYRTNIPIDGHLIGNLSFGAAYTDGHIYIVERTRH